MSRPFLALMDGDPPNPLRTHNCLLHLDHLDSWARQAQAAGYAEMPAHKLPSRIRLEGNNVAANQATAEYLVRLIRRGNERHYAEGDVGPATVLAHLLTLAQKRELITPLELADATDEALLAHPAVAGDSQVTALITLLRREPWRITVRRLTSRTNIPGHRKSAKAPRGALIVRLDALCDAVPLITEKGEPITDVSAVAQAEIAQVKELPGEFAVTWA